MKKKIGIVGWRLGENSFGVTNTYLEFASEFGQPHILMPQKEIEEVDAVLMPGGLDISPANYDEPPTFAVSSTDVFKEYFYKTNLPQYVANGIPVMGICLGFQQLNVFFGGKLQQHFRYHEQSPDRWKKAHDVHFENTVEAIGIKFNAPKQEVNSHHHQGVLRRMLGKDLIPLAWAVNKDADDEKDANNHIIEAFIHAELPVGGVQWHPEEWHDHLSREIFHYILNK